MKKQIKKTVRFDEDEYKLIEAKLKVLELNFSSFARNTLLNKKVKLPIETRLLYEVNKIGNNLNQIAKKVNSDEKISVLKTMIEIEKQLKKLCI